MANNGFAAHVKFLHERYVYLTQTRTGEIASRQKLLSLVPRAHRFRRPDALGVLHLRRAQDRWPGRRTVQIHLRVETIFQRPDLRALFAAVFFHLAAADFRVDERGFTDRW